MAIQSGIFGNGSSFNDRYIPDYEELTKTVEHLKGLGHTVVLTMGVFDLVHIGHSTYLEKAKEQGDVLIVGVDSDKLTKKRKGDDRPIVPQDERLHMLTHIRSVDIVTLRRVDEGMHDLIKQIKPDILVVSETTKDLDQETIQLFEDYCGEVVKLPPQAKTSTTERMRKLMINGAEALGEKLKDTVDVFMEQFKDGNLKNKQEGQ